MTPLSGPTAVADTALRRLDWLVIAYAGLLVVVVTWSYGGQIAWVRQFILGWGLVGAVLGILVLRRAAPRPALATLWPLAAFDLFVGVSCLNPSYGDLMRDGQVWMVPRDPLAWLPSAARPALAWRELAQFNVLVLSGWLLAQVLRTRWQVRIALVLLGSNAVALAVFGTVQKLALADGLWFGRVAPVNPLFFASFVYHNHWGAFMLLHLAAWLGLGFDAWSRGGPRGVWSTAAPGCAVAALLLAFTAPLSASRSCTVLGAVVLLAALLQVIRRLAGTRRLGLALLVLALTVAAVGLIAHLGRRTIDVRWRLTLAQVTALQHEQTLNARWQLYRDTWRMAAEKPWAGWGLESYAHVFRRFNTQRSVDNIPGRPFYAEAHNDWLQALAEVGFVGTALLVLLAVWPWRSSARLAFSTPLAAWLLAGGVLVAGYALLEFPFANPAVMLTFWVNLFAARRYAALSASRH